MASPNANFEIQVQHDGRWVMRTVVASEAEARTLAARLFADKKCEGARVVRNWIRADGRMVESELHCETRTIKDDAPIRVNQIDTAPPPCTAPNEFLALNSRMTINRLFRNYLDKTFLTPTEIMHNGRELKRLQDKDTLLPSAIDRVAFLQSRDGARDSKPRRDEIFKNVETMARRARNSDSFALPKIQGRFSDALHAIDTAAIAEEREYLALVVLSRDLVNLRNWAGKLEKLCELAVDEPDAEALTLLDGVIADVLGSSVVQDILGVQAGLGQAIISMVDLADGHLKTDKSEICEAAERLNGLFAARKLPASRLCLLDRAHRQLRSANPLYRNDPTKESDEFKRVLARLTAGGRFLSGPETAEALTCRFLQSQEQGGAAGRRVAIAGLFRLLPDRTLGIVYLCEMAKTELFEEQLAALGEQFDLVFRARTMAELCLRTLAPKERMLRVTAAHHAVAASPYPEALKAGMLNHLDTILDRYVTEEQIIEKLDHAESSLRDRAVRLVQFCASGVLPEGKALSRARARILDLLRHPHFDAHFIDGITDPAVAQQQLRNFHGLLAKAGFR